MKEIYIQGSHYTGQTDFIKTLLDMLSYPYGNSELNLDLLEEVLSYHQKEKLTIHINDFEQILSLFSPRENAVREFFESLKSRHESISVLISQ